MSYGLRWTEQQLAQLKGARATLAGQGQVKRAKFGNRRVSHQGLWFDSKRELAQWKALELQRATGAIRGVARQVSLPLPGTSRRARIDFMVVEVGGRIRFLDAKGFQTEASKLKYQALKDGYGIDIELC